MAEQTLLRRTLQEVNIRGKQYDTTVTTVTWYIMSDAEQDH